jgi:esterase
MRGSAAFGRPRSRAGTGSCEAMTERRDYPLEADGLRLFITEWGPADARPIVMLHGIRGYAETFAAVASALQPEFRVIAYDQRGRGRSDWDPQRNYYTDAYVRDLGAVVDRLALDRFDLLGHSMGGIVALVYAASAPQRVRRLVIEDAGPGAFERSAGAARIQNELRAAPLGFASWDAAVAYMRALRLNVTDAARNERLKSMLKAAPGGGFVWTHDHEGISQTRLEPDPARRVDLAAHVRAIACPTCVIRGDRSDYLQPDMVARMRTLNPRITTVDIADAGHYVHDDQPQAFATQVRAFLLQSECR